MSSGLFVRAVAMWLVLLAAMMGNGVFRVAILQPRLGESGARNWACLSGIAILVTLSGLFVRRLERPTRRELLAVGVVWAVLTVAFEFLFGHYVSGIPWTALLAEYDVRQGRLWPLVLLTTLVAPWLWGLRRGSRRDARRSG
jgi:hypothetical protein